MKKIMILMIGISLFTKANFSRQPNGIVKDSKTSLQWQDDYAPNNPIIQETSWGNALLYCENLVLAGYNDWHLPNIHELRTLIDHKVHSPAINSEFAYRVNGSNDGIRYWSSTSYAHDSDLKWVVSFYIDGYIYPSSTEDAYVRCVRAGQ